MDPLVGFLLFGAGLVVATLLYAWGRSLAPPGTLATHKREMYTGGEAPRAQEVRPSYEFYQVALFFTILHVAALVLVTAPGGDAVWLALLYLGLIGLALVALFRR